MQQGAAYFHLRRVLIGIEIEVVHGLQQFVHAAELEGVEAAKSVWSQVCLSVQVLLPRQLQHDLEIVQEALFKEAVIFDPQRQGILFSRHFQGQRLKLCKAMILATHFLV